MTRLLRSSAFGACLLLSATATPLLAQPAPDPHHPAEQGQAGTPPAPPGMMPRNNAGAPMAMPQTMQMTPEMMTHMMQMMQAMQQMPMMTRMGDAGMGMAAPPIDHIEGRIAYMHAELNITRAQEDAWSGFAAALRTNAARLRGLNTAPPPQTLADRLQAQEQWYGARYDGARAVRNSFARLTAVLTPEQKSQMDGLVSPHLGLSAGMAPGG